MALRSFGLVTVTTGGTPVNLAAALDLATGQPVLLQSVMVQAYPSNTAVGYVFSQMSQPPADHRSDGVGLVAVLPAPIDPVEGPFPSYSAGLPATPNGINLANLWLDAGGDNQKFIVSGTVG